MGGKKKGGGKKGDGGDDDKYDPSQMTVILAAQVQSLKERLASEQERRDSARATVEAKRVAEKETLQMINECKKKTEGIVIQMTECYKNLEENLLKEIAIKQQTVAKQKEEIKQWQVECQQIKISNEQLEIEKDNEIADLKKRIDEMTSEFAQMLKDTLTKMQERIEFANQQWEDENEISMLKKFEDMPGR